MTLSDSLSIALKEWAVICGALESGRQMILLRKGGIYEAGGEFELENPQFLLFPTYLHQSPGMLKAEAHGEVVAVNVEPGEVKLSATGVVTEIVRLRSRRQMEAIDDEHVWTRPLIDMRFNYKPENPLYLLLVRVYQLAQPVTIANTPAFAGCKSWVRLDGAVATTGSVSVLDNARYDAHRTKILNAIAQ